MPKNPLRCWEKRCKSEKERKSYLFSFLPFTKLLLLCLASSTQWSVKSNVISNFSQKLLNFYLSMTKHCGGGGGGGINNILNLSTWIMLEQTWSSKKKPHLKYVLQARLYLSVQSTCFCTQVHREKYQKQLQSVFNFFLLCNFFTASNFILLLEIVFSSAFAFSFYQVASSPIQFCLSILCPHNYLSVFSL